MSGLHHAVRGQQSRRWLAILLASGLMVWAMLLIATEHRAAAASGLTGPVIHPAAESTPNALPRTVCVGSGNGPDGACISSDAQGEDIGDGFGKAGVSAVERGYDVADDRPAGEPPVGGSSPVSWKAAPVDGSRAPPEVA